MIRYIALGLTTYMRRVQTTLLLPLATTAALMAEPASATEFMYQQAQDQLCSTPTQPIKTEWASELTVRLPEISSLWEAIGPSLINGVTVLTKKPFSAPSTVYLTLCNLPSNSFSGITVNMRYALRSFTSTPVPVRYKVDTVFHEALHQFVLQNTPRTSELLLQRTSESLCVRNHLHLLALQKAALLFTGDNQALAQVIFIDSQLPSGCYKRAWFLVNATPNAYLPYVSELSQ